MTVKYKDLELSLTKYKNKKIEINDQETANKIKTELTEEFSLKSKAVRKVTTKSSMPYVTSNLLQDAYQKLGFSPRKTTLLAQQLYEGIQIKSEILTFISYPRTDSVRLNQEFISNCSKYVTKK
jgi:DNA topoisomerase-1